MSLWPAVFAAWLAGDIDRPRVRVFERYLTGLNEVQVAGICRIAVPRAARLTTGQLAVLLRRMVVAIDPESAARWYRKAVAERNVIAYPAPDGTITLSANGLPADEAEAACVRLQHLASKAKRAGHPGLIGQIRCDLFLGLLDGRFHHMTSEQLIETLIAEYRAHEATERQEAPAPPEARPDAQSPDVRLPDAQSPDVRLPDGQRLDAQPPGARPDRSPGPDQRVGIEIRIGLATLLGHDEHPAEMPGLGLLLAPDARRRVRMQARAEWRFALTDGEGKLVFDGLTRRRPVGMHRDGVPGGIVELHLSVALLAELRAGDPHGHGEWATVLADIAAQYAHREDPYHDLDANPDARLPGAALRRHTEIRDRTCTFVGCRRRAHATQQDHTRDYHHGGATVRSNLGPLCPHDHQVKHLGGWRVEQRDPGTFVWHSPLGGVYRTSGEWDSSPMPSPVPADPSPVYDEVFAHEVVGAILDQPARTRPPDRPARRLPPHGDPYDPPPF